MASTPLSASAAIWCPLRSSMTFNAILTRGWSSTMTMDPIVCSLYIGYACRFYILTLYIQFFSLRLGLFVGAHCAGLRVDSFHFLLSSELAWFRLLRREHLVEFS
ncbi:hypothetical protein EMIT048CA2_260004 [Pseudomonas chlororaphis]